MEPEYSDTPDGRMRLIYPDFIIKPPSSQPPNNPLRDERVA